MYINDSPQDTVLWVFFMKKTTFLIDGFNLYGSVLDIQYRQRFNARWLDIKSILGSYLGLIDTEAIIEDIYFFTAIQTYLAPEKLNKINRHKNYMKCLESMGVNIIMVILKKEKTL